MTRRHNELIRESEVQPEPSARSAAMIRGLGGG